MKRLENARKFVRVCVTENTSGKRAVVFYHFKERLRFCWFDQLVLIRDTNSYRVYSDRSIIGSQMHEHDSVCPSVVQGRFEYLSPHELPQIEIALACDTC